MLDNLGLREPAVADETQKTPLLLERDGRVATVVINDAPWNRMSLDFMDELEGVVASLAADSSVGAVVFRGAGDEHFSVGMDLKQLPEGVKRKGSIDALFDQRLRVLAAIESMEKPAIATLYGYCLGGGLELPLACHFRLAAAEGAKIGLPEMDLGSVPAWGGTARLTRCVGRDHALDLILRAKRISGPEALRIGLVQEVWPNDELQRRAQALAAELAAGPSIAMAGVLRCVVSAGQKSRRRASRRPASSRTPSHEAASLLPGPDAGGTRRPEDRCASRRSRAGSPAGASRPDAAPGGSLAARPPAPARSRGRVRRGPRRSGRPRRESERPRPVSPPRGHSGPRAAGAAPQASPSRRRGRSRPRTRWWRGAQP